MYDFTTISFGQWMQRRRKSLDLTQPQLGERAGGSAAAIRKIEAEERRPSAQLAELLARALELSHPERETFLRAARGLAVPSLPANPAGASAASVATPNNVPAPLTSFVNRTHDIATVTRLLRTPDVRLLTLVGPPGIGKTRLATQAADLLLPDFPGGVWFVDIAAVTDPARVLPAIAHCVRLFELADEPMLDRLKGFWGEQRVLLLLDNFEHVVEAAPEVSGLLRACRGLKVLATSRTPLRVYGEHEYLAPPLALPPAGLAAGQLADYEAVQLFVTRVRQHQPGFDVDEDNAPDVQEILQKLDGIPLAIAHAAELAEVVRGQDWVRSLEAQALLAEAERLLPRREPDLAWAMLLTDTAELALGRGDAAAARGALTAALESAREHVRRLRYWLVTAAGLQLAEGGLDRARAAIECLAAEHGLGERGAPLTPVFHSLADEREKEARLLLGASAARELRDAARRWSVEQAVVFAETVVASGNPD